MDEIVFEYRNKNYGAYILRKLYNKNLTVSLLLAVFMLCAGLSYPFISSFSNKNYDRHLIDNVGVELVNKLSVEKVESPPLPPPLMDMKRFVFSVPKVTEDDIPDGGSLNPEDYSKGDVNRPIGQEEPGTPATVEPPVIDVEPEAEPPTSVQEMPSFVGGEAALFQYLANTIKYPKMARETNVQGKVYVSFVIDAAGNITQVKLLRGIGGGCDEEALRVISMMPTWNAGRQNGRAVRVLFHMPIVFRLAN
jgi:periplasmic protein TonB